MKTSSPRLPAIEPGLRSTQLHVFRRRGALTELVVVSLLILAVLWIPPLILTEVQADGLGWFKRFMKPREGYYAWRILEQTVFPLLGVFILYRLWTENPQWRQGFDLRRPGAALAYAWRNLWAEYLPAVRDLAAPTLIGIAALTAVGWSMHSLDLGTDRFWKKLYPGTLAGQFAQQAIIQLYFNRRAMEVFGPGIKSVLWLTVYFAMLHLPNPALTLGVLYGMFFWARTWQRHPNLLALTFSHCLLSAFLWHTIPEAWRPSLTVGWRYVERCLLQ